MVILASSNRTIRLWIQFLFSSRCPPIQEARMISIRSVTAIVVAVAAIHLHASALAGSWPERTVRVITPGAPGSSIDVAARLYAERLAGFWGKPIGIDKPPRGGGH